MNAAITGTYFRLVHIRMRNIAGKIVMVCQFN